MFQLRTMGVRGLFSAAAVALLACGSDQATAPPVPGVPSLRIVAGANVSDTVDARLPQALAVEVRDSLGRPLRDAVVRFEALREPQAQGLSIAVASLRSQFFGVFLADSTDAQGRAYALVALGTAAGPARIAVSAPAIGRADTARYTVVPGTSARIVMTTRDTALSVGKRFSPNAASADRYNNPRTDALAFASASPACGVDAMGVIDARSVGRCVVSVRSATAADTARATVVPGGNLVVVRFDFSGVTAAIVTMALDGTNARIRAPLRTSDAYPTATRDGARIVYRDTEHLYIVQDSSPARRLLPSTQQLAWEAWPRFSADGTWIYFAGGELAGEFLYRIRPDGTGLARIIPPTVFGTSPDPSPDGTKLAYTGSGLIRVMLLDSTRTVMTLGRGTQPRWSPSGDRIAFFDASGVQVIDADGSNMRQVTPSGRIYYDFAGLDWSADARWIVARSVGLLDLINVTTGEVLPLPFERVHQPAFLR